MQRIDVFSAYIHFKIPLKYQRNIFSNNLIRIDRTFLSIVRIAPFSSQKTSTIYTLQAAHAGQSTTSNMLIYKFQIYIIEVTVSCFLTLPSVIEALYSQTKLKYIYPTVCVLIIRAVAHTQTGTGKLSQSH